MNETYHTHECVGTAAHRTGGVLQPPMKFVVGIHKSLCTVEWLRLIGSLKL